MTFTFDQVHLGVPDPEAAARWYRQYLGATPGDHTDRDYRRLSCPYINRYGAVDGRRCPYGPAGVDCPSRHRGE